ncbi:hypothetical protein N8964_01280 [Pontimonas sp.]|nr:hypothetical protein [Pontimonas sp.]
MEVSPQETNRMNNLPVLIIGFNRTSTLRRVVEATLKSSVVGPIYISLDGPKQNSDGVANGIDPRFLHELSEMSKNGSRVKLLHQAENLGLGNHVRLAIDWIFESEAVAVILEDDCLPSQDFFSFASQMLRLYEAEKRVLTVAGTNMPRHYPAGGQNHFFSRYPRVWGWATWRDRWIEVDDLRVLPQHVFDAQLEIGLSRLDRKARSFWISRMSSSRDPDSNVWEQDLVIRALAFDLLTVVPSVNLVKNIGEGGLATHTTAFPKWIRESNHINEQELVLDPYPLPVVRDLRFDSRIEKLQFNIFPLKEARKRLKRRIDQAYSLIGRLTESATQ